jgi:hypothetical protein
MKIFPGWVLDENLPAAMGQSWSAARPSANSPPRALFLRSKVRGACESTGGGSNYNQSAPNSRLRGAKSERSLEADASVKLALAKACQHARRFSLPRRSRPRCVSSANSLVAILSLKCRTKSTSATSSESYFTKLGQRTTLNSHVYGSNFNYWDGVNLWF